MYDICMTKATMTFSKFLRESGPAVAQMETHNLLLERRDGADLYLKLAEREEAEHEILVMSLRLMASLMEDEKTRSLLMRQIPESLPWAKFLPEESRQLMLSEILDLVEPCVAVGDFTPLAVTLRQWKNTAEVYANPALLERLTGLG